MPTIEQQLDSVISRFPSALARTQVADIPRMAFALRLVERACGLRGALCDIGGGQELFAVACASLGMEVTMIDDFGDRAHQETGLGPLELYEQYRVNLINRDVVSQQLDLPEKAFDVVTSFDSMEHWHHSPKSLFQSVARAIKPGGTFILGVPNCVNLRKRITVPLGYGKWSSMADWYERPRFRGHVREPDVSDLHYIAHDMGLVDLKILGRNWFAYEYPARLVRAFAPVIDLLIRPIPSFCASIYLVARKKK